MNLGDAIKTQRKRLNLSQGELAGAMGITQAYLSQIEKNKKEPNLSTLKLLSEKLDIPLPVLFFKSLDDSDVPNEKKEAYGIINKSLNEMVNSIFFSEPA
ncbi:helix-turn-helix transcriptional regulator [Draconibacterium orientale]|uniref:helix-turn-helix domain-containing protein n=1 Tax=Draconibacterium orientale TaxID=1168034 RepID=UPI0029C0A1DA|nr:helix-turn-helix transcriptional regulator [Draconibacterium orientale]